MPPDQRPVIIMCPCCGATLDVFIDVTEFNCLNCGQQWSMIIDLDRIEQHSLQ